MLIERDLLAAALPGYDIGLELGRGEFGVVFAGRHRRSGGEVAVKLLVGPARDTPDLPAQFATHGRLAAGLEHPHVARVHDYTERDDTYVLVTERLSGGGLRQRLNARLSGPAAGAVGLAVAGALDVAHARGLRHGDLKPANILFTAEGTPKVTDFGLAELVDCSRTATGMFGTPRYMAPEQINGRGATPATDLYALGVVLYEMLTGRPPFGRNLSVTALLHSHLALPPAPLDDIAPPLARLVAQLLAKNPAARPASARAASLDLATAARRVFGPDWLAEVELPIWLDDEVRAAGGGRTRSGAVHPAGAPSMNGRPGSAGPDAAAESVSGRAAAASVPLGSGTERAASTAAATVPAAAGGGAPGGGHRDDSPGGSSGGDHGSDGPAGDGGGPLHRDDGQDDDGEGDGEGDGRPSRRTAYLVGGIIGVSILIAGLLAVLPGRSSHSRVATFPITASYAPAPRASAAGPRAPGAFNGSTVRIAGLEAYTVGIDAANDLYVNAGESEIVKIEPNGRVVPVAGTATMGGGGDGGSATRAGLSAPAGIAVDPGTGDVYVSDSGNNRIRKITRAGVISTVAGTGTSGDTGDGGSARAATLAAPAGLAFDPRTRRLYIAEEGGNRVRVLAPDGTITTLAGLGTLRAPKGVAVDGAGNVLVTDTENSLVRRVSPAGAVTVVAGTGHDGFAGDGGPATGAALFRPVGLAVAGGVTYIADRDNNRLRQITGGIISTVAGTGPPEGGGDGGPAAKAPLNIPDAVVVDSAGNLYIADYGNNSIRRITRAGTITTIITRG